MTRTEKYLIYLDLPGLLARDMDVYAAAAMEEIFEIVLAHLDSGEAIDIILEENEILSTPECDYLYYATLLAEAFMSLDNYEMFFSRERAIIQADCYVNRSYICIELITEEYT